MTRYLLIGLLAFGAAQVAHAQGRPIRPIIRPQPFPGGEAVEYTKLPLPELLKMIKTKDQRLEGAMGLADYGSDAAPALPDLAEAIKTGSDEIRLNAAIALGKIGKASLETATQLAASEEADVRFYAIWTFGLIGPDAKSSATVVAKALADKNEGIRRKAAFSLGRLGLTDADTVEILVKSLETDANEDVRMTAADALSKIGTTAVPALVRAFEKSEKPEINLAILNAFEHIGSDAKAAVPAIQKKFLVEKAHVHQYAQALSKIGKEGLPGLMAGAKASDPTVRQVSISHLGQVNPEGAPLLIDLLGEKEVEVRRQAIQTLAGMRVGDKSVVVAFAYSLKDADETVRQGAMQGIQILGPLAKAAAPKVMEALTDLNPNVRQQAFYTLQNMGENPREGLKKALDSKNDTVRIGAAALMMQVGFEPELAQPILLDALASANKTVRAQAAITLAQFRRELEKVVPILVEGLKNESADVRRQTLVSLQNLGDLGATAVPAILEALEDPDVSVRRQAIYAANNYRNSADKFGPAMMKLAKDENNTIRQAVMQVIWQQGAKAIPIAIQGLKDTDANVRQQAVFALQNIRGGNMKEHLEVIAPLMKDPNDQIRMSIAGMLGNVQDESVVPLLVEAIKDKNQSVVYNALYSIQRLGARASKATPALAELLESKDANARNIAMSALMNIGGDGPELVTKVYKSTKNSQAKGEMLRTMVFNGGRREKALPLIEEAMQDKDQPLRMAAVQCLQNLAHQSQPAYDALVKAMNDEDKDVRVQAIQGVQNFGQKSFPALEAGLKSAKDSQTRQYLIQGLVSYGYSSKTAVPELIVCLKDGSPQVRMLACQSLANIGAGARDAATALEALKEDANPNVRTQATNALSRIGAAEKK